MHKLMNRTDRYHLYYLIVNNVREEQFRGLAHVAEHTLLFPEEKILRFSGKGYTYLNHVCLYYTCDSLDVLSEVDRQVWSGKAITNSNVCGAKQQVIDEINSMAEQTQKNLQIVDFVTDGRINQLSMGTVEQVKRIQTNDILKWFCEKKQNGHIYRYLFQDAHNMILSTPLSTTLSSSSESTQRKEVDSVTADCKFYNNLSSRSSVKVYLKIPVIYGKEDHLQKVFSEYCIQRKLEEDLNIDTLITDEYFEYNERYSALYFQITAQEKIVEILELIRHAIGNISLTEFTKYKAEFELLKPDLIKSEETNFDIINKMKNWILYHTPQIEIKDWEMIKFITYESFRGTWIADAPLRIVIK